MQQIDLAAVPNQSLSISLDNNQYFISVKQSRGCMSVSITRNNVPIVTNIRAVAGAPVIPYEYLEDGNFFFDTMNDDLPDYTQFGTTQTFLYVSQAEITELRAGA